MPDNDSVDSATHRERTAEIVSAYLRNHQVPTDQLAGLIKSVHESLHRLGEASEPVSAPTPAVPIRRSVHRDHVICLDCGWRGQMLRRHIKGAHGLSADEYRARWRLSPDHLLTAPAYSERRSGLARQFGLGRGGRATPSKTPVVSAPKNTTVGRRRPRANRRSTTRSA
jgi:predicted transcriptional regulator